MNAPATATATATATASPTRRSRRDWVVDTLLFLVAVVSGLLAIGGQMQSPTPPVPAWLFTADVIAGALGCAAVWLRRRWPVGVALTLIALATFSEVVGGAMVVGLFTVAVHRPPRTTGRVFALSVLAALVYVVIRPDPEVPRALVFLVGSTRARSSSAPTPPPRRSPARPR